MFSKKIIIAMMFILMLAAGSLQAGHGDAARGAELAADCADCHGDAGEGDGDYAPKLAGLDAAEHIKMLEGFKGSDSEMADYVEDLSEQDIHDLAAYYATLGG